MTPAQKTAMKHLEVQSVAKICSYEMSEGNLHVLLVEGLQGWHGRLPISLEARVVCVIPTGESSELYTGSYEICLGEGDVMATNDEERIRKFVYRQLGEGPKTFADLRVKMCRVFGSEFNGKFSPLLLHVLRGEAEKGALRLDFESLYHVAVAEPDKGDEQDDASRILDLPRALAIEVIAGFIELANMSGSGRGYQVVMASDQCYLEDRKYPDDRTLEGYSEDALKVLATHLKGR